MVDQEKAAEFLASAGMYLACADGKVDPVEKEVLKSALLNLNAEPDKYLYFKDWDTHEKRMLAICSYFAKSDLFTKSFLFGLVSGVAICDGVLHENEKKSLYKTAELLELDEEVVDEILKMLLGYLS